MPHAVACALYHYHSNALGGVKTEYYRENDRKAWVRYPPPRWIWRGTAICAIPREVNEAHAARMARPQRRFARQSRLGFVCTGQTVNGDAGLEGYYLEYDQPDRRRRASALREKRAHAARRPERSAEARDRELAA
jgi:hypothetical protein